MYKIKIQSSLFPLAMDVARGHQRFTPPRGLFPKHSASTSPAPAPLRLVPQRLRLVSCTRRAASRLNL